MDEHYGSNSTTGEQVGRLVQLLSAQEFDDEDAVIAHFRPLLDDPAWADMEPPMRLVHGAFTMMHRFDDDDDQPLVPVFQAQTWRTPEPDDYSGSDLSILSQIMAQVSDPVVVSRIGDILWLRKRDGKAGSAALDAYITLAQKYLGNPEGEKWIKGQNYYHRAIRLWRRLGADDARRHVLIRLGSDALNLQNPEPNNYRRVRLMEIVADHGICDEPDAWVGHTDRLAEEARQRGDYEKARDYWECSIGFARFTASRDQWKQFLAKQADCWVEQARAMNHPGNSALNVRGLFAEAIEACRRAGGRRDLIDQLHREMNEVQQQALEELHEIQHEFDASKLLEEGRRAATDGSIEDAILAIASYAQPTPKDALRERAEKGVADSPWMAIVSALTFDEKGRVAAIKPSGLSGKDADLAVTAEMTREAALDIEITSKTCIEAARRELDRRVPTGSALFRRLLAMNPFVPEGRELLFEEGLIAGLRGNWSVCAHILIPQLENSIRCVAEQNEVMVTRLAKNSTQNELDLNTLLYEEKVEEIFGESKVFYLRTLLIDKLGYNLRNRVAHGLIGYHGLGPNPVNFLWATTLYLCVLGKQGIPTEDSTPSDPDGSEE